MALYSTFLISYSLLFFKSLLNCVFFRGIGANGQMKRPCYPLVWQILPGSGFQVLLAKVVRNVGKLHAFLSKPHVQHFHNKKYIHCCFKKRQNLHIQISVTHPKSTTMGTHCTWNICCCLPEHMKSLITLNHCKGSALLKLVLFLFTFILIVDVQIHTRLVVYWPQHK